LSKISFPNSDFTFDGGEEIWQIIQL
jgi:hypothetical protein